jgi:hypothetical protein
MGEKSVDWVHQARDRNKLRALANLVVHLQFARSEILTAMLMKIKIFWDIMSSRMANRCRRFEGL